MYLPTNKKEKPIELFDNVADIKVRGSGFDDALPMINVGGVAQIVNNQTTERILNPSSLLVNGTGDLSILPGSLPLSGTSINNVPIRSGGGTRNIPAPSISAEPIISIRKDIKEK